MTKKPGREKYMKILLSGIENMTKIYIKLSLAKSWPRTFGLSFYTAFNKKAKRHCRNVNLTLTSLNITTKTIFFPTRNKLQTFAN